MALIEFDFSRLRGRIVEKYGSCSAFAEAMGYSSGWLSNRLSNVVHWAGDEIAEACRPDRLDIPPEKYHHYFFVPKFR